MSGFAKIPLKSFFLQVLPMEEDYPFQIVLHSIGLQIMKELNNVKSDFLGRTRISPMKMIAIYFEDDDKNTVEFNGETITFFL